MRQARSISIVLPLFQARSKLPRVLPPLLAAVESGEAAELLVVDDGSTDGGPEYCREQGVRVLSSGGRVGPGAARNVGVEAARGDTVLFIDSDVVMNRDVPSRVLAALAREERCVAVFGSYDDRPPERGFVSQYMNLRHHHVHQNGSAEATTFWAGCGAVDRAAFLEVGGYDGERFPRPSIEDIDLGYRLRAKGGRIVLDKDMQCTHLKRWTLASMIRTDVLCRALPWSRLMLRRQDRERELNVSPGERLRALLSLLTSASLLAGALYPPALLATAALLVAIFLVNRDFHLLVLRRRGVLHMLASVVLHQIYYHYSVLCYVYCLLEARLSRASPTSAR